MNQTAISLSSYLTIHSLMSLVALLYIRKLMQLKDHRLIAQ